MAGTGGLAGGTLIQRVFDAAILNRVLNDPAVFPWVSAPGIDYLDFNEIAADVQNVVLMTDRGGFVFVPKGRGVYEVHTQFLPSGATTALAAARDAARYMFTLTECERITTYVPLGNDRARKLTEAMGFTHTGRDGSWTYPSGDTVPLDWYELTKEDWKCQQQQ